MMRLLAFAANELAKDLAYQLPQQAATKGFPFNASTDLLLR